LHKQRAWLLPPQVQCGFGSEKCCPFLRGTITYLHLDPRGSNYAVLDEWNFAKRRA